MGVYIPNMEKPKSCFDCFAYDGEFMECRATGECVNETFYDKVRDDCPLIEIVRCGECQYADEYNHCKYSAWWNGNADFCSHGIRRKESR